MSKPVKKVVIKRSRWSSPGPAFTNKLYTVAGKKMCCLGFCAREAGLSVAQIKGRPDPDYLEDADRAVFNRMFPGFTESVLTELMGINDDKKMSRSERERQLTQVASKAGVKFEFVD